MGELLNCQMCGRDTRNKSGVCRHCVSGVGLQERWYREIRKWRGLTDGERDRLEEFWVWQDGDGEPGGADRQVLDAIKEMLG